MLLKLAEINKKLLTFRKGGNFIVKTFQTKKFCQRADNNWKCENKS